MMHDIKQQYINNIKIVLLSIYFYGIVNSVFLLVLWGEFVESITLYVLFELVQYL